ncbi:autotransporter outer membrane beta-barrel domain-containing protein [Spirosoma endbachense]|uniref:BZIP transcription factor n=1 Tax=Spirosoma endbachense TaxID=2666025 RepID=A0A6P1W4C6_9BACT|nr:bZIP transcription factor [Spirosoma endbachense]QHV98859.1 bZIP transcription factor [Spirosoma endbachense]
MKAIYSYLIGTLVVLPVLTRAQNNYVANTSNSATPGSNNTLVGTFAGNFVTTGSNNVFLGGNAGFFNTTGSLNTFTGSSAGYSNSTGGNNTFTGYYAGFGNQTGSFNAFLGFGVGRQNTTGSSNTLMGPYAGYSNQTGSQNTFMGYYAGYNNVASGNTFIGYQSGTNNTSGQYNTFLGYQANAGSGGLVNATALGNNATVNVSDAVVIGNNAKVGIGTSSPTNRLHINSGEVNKSGLRLEEVNDDDPVSRFTNKFLSVDGDGNVILAGYSNGGREAAVESLWQRKGRFLQSSNDDAVIIGQNVLKTPAGYRLFVQEGILTEKVKVAIKNTADWSDKVFAPAYKLQSLVQVEQYITAHQHLPGVPSAEQLVKEGMDVAKMDAKLLEKIEELTLYLIEQRKELANVQEQNRQLKERMMVLESKVNH